jgi:hypothetical protein
MPEWTSKWSWRASFRLIDMRDRWYLGRQSEAGSILKLINMLGGLEDSPAYLYTSNYTITVAKWMTSCQDNILGK